MGERALVWAGPGISAGTNGGVLKDGRPFRGIGVNYFDCFLRTLAKGDETSYDAGFAVLAARGIPFARFCATGFWPKDMQLYLTNREEYFRRLDGVVRSAQRHGIGLVPSLFWHDATVPGIVGEPVGEWGNPKSRTQAFMREYVREVVTRYRENPAIWLWEFGNEYALGASLPNAAKHRPPAGPELGAPASRSEHDDLTFAMVSAAFADFAKEVRKYDAQRLIVTGDSFPRSSAWHQTHETNWTGDTQAQFAEILNLLNPEPVDAISVHLYAVDEARLGWAAQAARKLNKPLFVGEFGAPGATPAAEVVCRRQIKALLDNEVPLAALWVFDFKSQKEFDVTADNARAAQLEWVAEANQALAPYGAARRDR